MSDAELIECRVCKREMASSAKKCPHCGNPNPDYRESLNHWGCVGASIVVVGDGSDPADTGKSLRANVNRWLGHPG